MTDVQPVKDIQKVMWSLGDYRELARQFEPTAVALVEACGIGPGMEVLEVAAGTGNLAVAAARRGARVVATDLTPRMVELGRERSAGEGLDIEWREADAEELPFEDGRFEVAASTFGAMFAPRPQVAAAELFRVVRSGGTVGMANMTPQGYLGRLIATAFSYGPPPPGPWPSTWSICWWWTASREVACALWSAGNAKPLEGSETASGGSANSAQLVCMRAASTSGSTGPGSSSTYCPGDIATGLVAVGGVAIGLVSVGGSRSGWSPWAGWPSGWWLLGPWPSGCSRPGRWRSG